jgi:hypothetical protein
MPLLLCCPFDAPVSRAQAFARWRMEHTVTAHAVREALRGGPSREAQLRTLADEARSQLWGFFQVGCEHVAHACSDASALL